LAQITNAARDRDAIDATGSHAMHAACSFGGERQM